MYGVSPHPAQAPENSKSGSRSWTSFTCVCETRPRPISGRDKKNSQLALSFCLSAGWGTMFMALCLASLLLFTGQTSMQSWHPVQSSGETCSVYLRDSNSRQRGLADLKVDGAPASNEES